MTRALILSCLLACTPESAPGRTPATPVATPDGTREAKRDPQPPPTPEPQPEPQPEPPAPTTAVTWEPPPPEPVLDLDFDLSGYSRACKRDKDCLLVQSSPCSICGCGHDPIAAAEHKRFLEARAAIECPPRTMAPGSGCGGCITRRPACEKGTCVAK